MSSRVGNVNFILVLFTSVFGKQKLQLVRCDSVVNNR